MSNAPAPQRDDEPAAAVRRRRDPEATRSAILDAAERLFVEKGPAATTTNEIARRARVTKSLIHHHFGTKEELWGAVKQRGFDEYYERQQAMIATPPEGTAELLRASLVAYFEFLRHHPEAVRFMAWRSIEEDDLCLEQEEELFARGAERIREAQERGELRPDVEPLHVIKSFLAMVVHWFQTKHLFCQIVDPDADPDELDRAYLEDIQKIFLEGVVRR